MQLQNPNDFRKSLNESKETNILSVEYNDHPSVESYELKSVAFAVKLGCSRAGVKIGVNYKNIENYSKAISEEDSQKIIDFFTKIQPNPTPESSWLLKINGKIIGGINWFDGDAEFKNENE